MRESRTRSRREHANRLSAQRSLPVSRPCTLARLTPRNAAESLYNDVPWPKRAAEEHDAFAAVLERRGIAVDYLGPLLEAALGEPSVRAATVPTAVEAPALPGPTSSAAAAAAPRRMSCSLG